MFSEISWGNYLTAAAVLLAVYFTIIAVVFYRDDIRAFVLSGKRAANDQQGTATGGSDHTAAFDALESIVHEIDSILEQAGTGATTDQLLPQLKRKLAGYAGLRLPAYRVAVFNHIIKQAEEICGVRISEQELEG